MFAKPQITLNLTPFQQQQRTIIEASTKLNIYVHQVVQPASQRRADATINAAPGPHKRPTNWQSEKQRRWWFAVGVKAWHGRTGRVRAWKIVGRYFKDGGELTAENDVPYARFVFGPDQQRMHFGTWTHRDTFIAQESALVIADIQAGWKLVSGATP